MAGSIASHPLQINLVDILKIDPERRTVRCEPLVTMGQLTEALDRCRITPSSLWMDTANSLPGSRPSSIYSELLLVSFFFPTPSLKPALTVFEVAFLMKSKLN